jgi:hypothetical protein
VKDVSAYRKRVRIAFGLLLLACALVAAAILALGVEAVFFLPVSGRQVLLSICGLGLMAILVRFVLFPLLVGPSLERLAGLIDAHYPRLRNGLVSALQLWRKRDQERNPEGYSTELMEAAVVAAERRSRDLDVRAAVDRSRIRRILHFGALLT